jgi:predicted N-acetyltransferase YhbS
VHPDFGYLKTEMLEYAEKYLSVENNYISGIFSHILKDTPSPSGKKIAVWVNDFDTEFESIVMSHGYQLVEGIKGCWSFFEIPDPFPAVKLPAGFKIQSLADEDDLSKLARLIYRGFNHPGEPPADAVQGTALMQSAPNYRKDLNIVAVAQAGTYTAYGGIWQDHKNKIAYIEPVCTDPDYRRVGLGRAVVFEGIRRCGVEGANIAMVGSEQPFYLSMGFKKLFDINLWTRQIN